MSKSIDKDLNGKLMPKGDKAKTTVKYGAGFLYGQVQYGESENNAIRAHQKKTGMYDGCYISATRSFDKAKHFATTGNTEDGYVYILDEDLFEKYRVSSFELDHPEFPDEEEVSLRAKDCREIPQEVIVDKIEIKCT